MDAVDLARLTDHDFEEVCKDLFEAVLAKRLEIFSRGKDEGIDLRHIAPAATAEAPQDCVTIVIQCKHWMRSNASALIRHMTNVEYPKVERVSPERYILATSTHLTKAAKDELVSRLKPFVKSHEDIYGLDELVALLRDYPDVVRKNIRLWLSSAAVLSALLNRDMIQRSVNLAEEIDETLRVYVPNASFNRARQVLDASRVCLLSGIPGVGKTTLAQVLAADYVSRGYQLVEISEDANEAFRAWDSGALQFFYYDDFLGQTSLTDKLNKNEDGRLFSLMRKISTTPGKRLILTTREYILQQAKARYERLSYFDFNPLQCVVDLSDYVPLVRAEILYNHVYHSGLPQSQRALFAKPEHYEPILKHRNFNPRLVALSLKLSPGDELTNAVEVVMHNLHDPQRIWHHVIESQLSEAAVALLEVLFTFRFVAEVSTLKTAWSSYARAIGIDSRERIFRAGLAELENSLVRISNSADRGVFASLSPSARDYLARYLAQNSENLRRLIESEIELDRLGHLASLYNDSDLAELHDSLNEARPAVISVLQRKAENLDMQKQDTWAEGRNRYNGWLNDANEIFKIAIAVDVQDVVDTIVDAMGTDWIASVTSPDHLVELATIVANNPGRFDNAAAANIHSEVVEWAAMDIGSWGNASMAVDMLRPLSALDVQGAAEELQRVEDTLDELAVEQVETWFAEDEYFEDVSEETLRDVVEYIDHRWRLRYSDISGLAEARDALSMFDEAKRDAEHEAWRRSEDYSQVHDREGRSDTLARIESLMRLLDQEN